MKGNQAGQFIVRETLALANLRRMSFCSRFALVSPVGFAGKQMHNCIRFSEIILKVSFTVPYKYKLNDFSTGELGTRWTTGLVTLAFKFRSREYEAERVLTAWAVSSRLSTLLNLKHTCQTLTNWKPLRTCILHSDWLRGLRSVSKKTFCKDSRPRSLFYIFRGLSAT